MIEPEPYVITSHRKYIGWILIFFRKLINGEVRRYVDPKFEQLERLVVPTPKISIVESITCTFLPDGTITFTRTGTKNLEIITKNRTSSTFEKMVGMMLMYVNMD
jgi:hypothetical protein